MYCRWMQLLSWNPIRCFREEQHSFNKCTLPCRRDLPGATACLERKCCLMNIYWLWIFIKLTSLWPASGFVTSVAVKWLSKVFDPVLELLEAQITIKITDTRFSSGMENNSEIFWCGHDRYQRLRLVSKPLVFEIQTITKVTGPFISNVFILFLADCSRYKLTVLFHFLSPLAYSTNPGVSSCSARISKPV